MSMDTDRLIKTLAADNAHRARPVAFVLALALLSAAPVSILIFVGRSGGALKGMATSIRPASPTIVTR